MKFKASCIFQRCCERNPSSIRGVSELQPSIHPQPINFVDIIIFLLWFTHGENKIQQHLPFHPFFLVFASQPFGGASQSGSADFLLSRKRRVTLWRKIINHPPRFFLQSSCMRAEGKIVSLNIITLGNLTRYTQIHRTENTAAAAKKSSMVTRQSGRRQREGEKRFPCAFFMPLLPSEPFACASEQSKRPGRREKITLQWNRCRDTGRQLYFNLLGEYTNNQFRLWRRTDGAVFAAVYCYSSNAWSWTKMESREKGAQCCHMLRNIERTEQN